MELINNVGKTLRDDLMQQMQAGSRLSIAASCFSIYAFQDGLKMGKYSELLGKAIQSIVTKKEESDMDSFLEGFTGELFDEKITGLDDFELICFLVIK